MTSSYFIDRLANMIWGMQGTPPTTYYIGLLLSTPELDGSNVTEVSTAGTAYARQALGNNKTAFTTATGTGEVSNVSGIQFPAATANWGTITDVGVFDALTGGNLLFWSTQPSPKLYEAQDIAFFNPGDIRFIVQNIID